MKKGGKYCVQKELFFLNRLTVLFGGKIKHCTCGFMYAHGCTTWLYNSLCYTHLSTPVFKKKKQWGHICLLYCTRKSVYGFISEETVGFIDLDLFALIMTRDLEIIKIGQKHVESDALKLCFFEIQYQTKMFDLTKN